MYRVCIELYKHEWTFGRTRNAVNRTRETEVRKFKNFNSERFLKDLQAQPWAQISFYEADVKCNVELLEDYVLIMRHFDYCCEVWDSLGSVLAERRQKLHNRCARVIMRYRNEAGQSEYEPYVILVGVY